MEYEPSKAWHIGKWVKIVGDHSPNLDRDKETLSLFTSA